ncbi:hypothetical protein I7I48_06836 [Histoplasma ohiense]|nr:hypothetical protein I7I48_06836 [Histoplasma ohiense (nom. inval.)]
MCSWYPLFFFCSPLFQRVEQTRRFSMNKIGETGRSGPSLYIYICACVCVTTPLQYRKIYSSRSVEQTALRCT